MELIRIIKWKMNWSETHLLKILTKNVDEQFSLYLINTPSHFSPKTREGEETQEGEEAIRGRKHKKKNNKGKRKKKKLTPSFIPFMLVGKASANE